MLDKVVLVLDALARGPASLATLVDRTGISRPTAHRLAVALEHHRLVSRDSEGRFRLGSRLAELAGLAGSDRLIALARPVLRRLRDVTGESSQLYVRDGSRRRCIATAELPHGLRNTVPVGSILPMTAGSAAQVFLAWGDSERELLDRASFSAATLAAVRKRGWAASVGQREAGVASISAPVFGPGDRLLAAISISGPIERLTRSPGRLHGRTIVAASRELSRLAGHGM